MKWFLLLSILMLSLASYGQNDSTTIAKQLLATDSLAATTKQLKDSISNSISSIRPENDYSAIDKNMRYIQEIQKKNDAKKRRNAIVRISIGLFFLVLLVVGWRRKAKK